MSSEHKRPLYAFAIVAMLCAFFVGSGLRSDAMQGLLRVAEIPVSLDLVERTEKAPEPEDSPETVSPRTTSPLLATRSTAPVLPAAANRAPRSTAPEVTPAVATRTQPAVTPAVAKDKTKGSAERPGRSVKPGKGKGRVHTHGKGARGKHPHGERVLGKHPHGKHPHGKQSAWSQPGRQRGHVGKGESFTRKGAHQAHQHWRQQGGKSARHTSSVQGKPSARALQARQVNRGQAKKASSGAKASKSASGWNRGKGNGRGKNGAKRG